ncbi:S-adenosyl-L-methionine-dependent methyltransferase [Lentinula aciculospora]|uniref:S-adenosyl-L-methionine-dependent methyltransferase n=1 Tax=Lentinula aciculospora TaxID=153920 RepID=A0A9W9AEG3_9AGAR|nr:S-adenosyl-L-methionine-dependent methyltransferase [Lentinula aciculospora]
MVVHSIAQQGFGVGTNEVYDRARPSYQPAVLSHIRQSINTKDQLNIVEIGAGTGIFTRALIAHPDWSLSIAEIRAVEPSAGMRAQFNKTVIHPQSNANIKISVKDGSFTETGIEEGWADMVIIAQAYHWAHPAYDAASAEFARILKPIGGVVVYVWNLEDQGSAKWIASLRSLYEKYEGNSPQFRLGQWRVTFDPEICPGSAQLFEKPVEDTFEWVMPTTVEDVVERMMSKSYIAVLESEKKEEHEKLVQRAKELLGREDMEKNWIGKEKGVFEYPYKTTLIIARKK